MEELQGTRALEKEILDEASRKAERLVRKGIEEAERIAGTSRANLDARLSSMKSRHAAELAAIDRQLASRLPLEKTRLKAGFIDGALRAAVDSCIEGLGPQDIGAWCVAGLRQRACFLEGARADLRYRGIDKDSLSAIRGLLEGCAGLDEAEDPRLPSRGIILRDAGDSVRISLTEAEMKARLLDENRGELAAALFRAEAGEI